MSKRRLLLADDSLTVQKVVNLTFTDEGFDVQTVGDGESALQALYQERPDVMLLDVNMPGPNGYEICETIRRDGQLQHIPVILLVGSFEPFDELQASNVGANAFLTKPFASIRQLVSQVTELLESAPGPAASEPNESVPSAQELSEMYGPSEPFSPPNPPRASADDIDQLYSQSFASEGTSEGPAAPANLDDSGLDDEMIETSYLSQDSNGETLDFEIAQDTEAAVENGKDEPQISDYYQEPERESFQEPHSSDPFASTVSEERGEEQPEQEGDAAQYIQYQDAPSSQGAFASDQSQSDAAQYAQYQDVSQNPETSGWEQGAGADDVSENEMPTEQYSAFHERVPENASDTNESLLGVETVRFEPPQRSFQDIDLLDIPPAESNETVELTTAERAELMGSDKRVVTISPELMEMIVEKVVERLSNKY